MDKGTGSLEPCPDLIDVEDGIELVLFFLLGFDVVDVELVLFFPTEGVRPMSGKTILGAVTGTMLVLVSAAIVCFFFLFGGPLQV